MDLLSRYFLVLRATDVSRRLRQTGLLANAARYRWSFGSNKVQLEAEMRLLEDVLAAVQNDHVRGDHAISALSDRTPAFPLPGQWS